VFRTVDERCMHCFAYRLSRPLKAKLTVTQDTTAVDHAHVALHVKANLHPSAMLHDYEASLRMRQRQCKETVTKQ